MRFSRAILMLGAICAPMQASIIVTAVGSGACTQVANRGCIAAASSVTGDGAGQTIHLITFDGPGGATLIDPDGVASYTGGGAFDSGSGLSGDSTHFLSVFNGAVETITFSTPIDYFGLYWGSIDSSNTVVLKSSGTTVLTYSPGTPGAGNQSPSGDSYVSFNATGQSFDQITLSYGGCCFETDNHAYVTVTPNATPEPASTATGLTGLIALLGLGFYLRRTKAAAQAA